MVTKMTGLLPVSILIIMSVMNLLIWAGIKAITAFKTKNPIPITVLSTLIASLGAAALISRIVIALTIGLSHSRAPFAYTRMYGMVCYVFIFVLPTMIVIIYHFNAKRIKDRISREAETVEKMVVMYCRGTHGRKGMLCRECDELLTYAFSRLQNCPFQEGKTTCAKCPVHCYGPDMKERIREVMRCSGPRMLFYHPVSALWHMVDGLRKKPGKRNCVK